MMEYLDRCIRVSDLSLREDRLVPTMLQATRWMGQFHAANEARAASGELAFLTRYDARYYRGWIRRTYKLAGPLLPRFPWLQELRGRRDEWMSPLLAAPRTFIHGELYATHLLLRRNSLFCIDWESAALAPGEIDLATLTEGKGWPVELVHRCEQEYCRARWPEGAPAGFERTLDAARMYLHFRWLGERPEWTLAEKYLWRYEHLRAAAGRLGLIEGPPAARLALSGGAL
jgi:aminoglycoside phosphotransferase (APT) family kinase protein